MFRYLRVFEQMKADYDERVNRHAEANLCSTEHAKRKLALQRC
jgi:hypothetical protein